MIGRIDQVNNGFFVLLGPGVDGLVIIAAYLDAFVIICILGDFVDRIAGCVGRSQVIIVINPVQAILQVSITLPAAS